MQFIWVVIIQKLSLQLFYLCWEIQGKEEKMAKKQTNKQRKTKDNQPTPPKTKIEHDPAIENPQ